MSVIHQLPSHIANLIAAGEVVERPASVVKELLENAVDAGATKVTVEIQNGGMTFLRLTDNGCGMEPRDAETAFLRHATSKLREASDLDAIGTMGFRGEALAAIASVSRIDLMTKPAGAVIGTSLHLEGGNITERSEAGCPEGTTIIIRDLFFNTPARMKFMKSDTVEGSRVSAAVEMQALAHPELAITYIRDGKPQLTTPGTGKLKDAVYCVYGRECAKMISVDSSWEKYAVTGFVSKPTDARPSRNLQTFFVNDRPVKSRLLISALEEAYRNQIMAGKFPSCVLHLQLPPASVDVNVHPAKTEVKFLNEKAVFDCIHYGVLAALNRTPDRPDVQFRSAPVRSAAAAPVPVMPEKTAVRPAAQPKQDFFRTMTSQEYKAFTAPPVRTPSPEAAKQAYHEVARQTVLRQDVQLPAVAPVPEVRQPAKPLVPPAPAPKVTQTVLTEVLFPEPKEISKAPESAPVQSAPIAADLPETQAIPQWRLVGELYRSYVIVEQGDEAFLIDKHAAHERILFDKLKANQGGISAQSLITPISLRTNPNAAAILLSNQTLLESLGFSVEEFGENTLLIRQIPMDLSPEDAADTLDSLSADLLAGKTAHPDTVRDEVLHTVACKAAIKAGWSTDEQELRVLVDQVMSRQDLKYCPHGRPICISLSKKQLEKQFKRS